MAYRATWPWVALLVAAGCGDLSDFQGRYEGAIIDGNFVRRCFAPSTEATLDFRPEAAVDTVEATRAPNLLTTSDGVFTQTPLVPLSALSHDQMSQLDFPGPSRVRNFLLLARPTQGPLSGRDAMVVVSLLEKGGIEVRVMGRADDAAEPCTGEAGGDNESGDGREYFGVFQLKG